MSLNSFGQASIVFLVLYTILFCFLIFHYATKRFAWKSRWTLLLFHVTVRLAAQSVGIAFAVIGYSATGLLIAFLILSAEGYFTLMLCGLRALVSWHHAFLPDHHSWLEAKEDTRSVGRKVLSALFLLDAVRDPLSIMHFILIIANVMIIVGGNILGGGSHDASETWYLNNNKVTTSKALRCAGQSLFFLLALVIGGLMYYTYYRAIKSEKSGLQYRHTNELVLIMAILPFLYVRGIFGICQSVVNSLNYFFPQIYGPYGFRDEFVIKETVLATAMEWTSCAILLSTSLIRKNEYDKKNDPENVRADDKIGRAATEEK